MSHTKKAAVIVSCLVLTLAGVLGARVLLAKTAYYAAGGRTDKCTYWALYFGSHTCTIERTYPGEPPESLEVDFNISLLSNGYVEASGYGDHGRIQSEPDMMAKTENGLVKIDHADIRALFAGGRRIIAEDDIDGEFIINVEGFHVRPDRMVLRLYKAIAEYEGGEAVISHEKDFPVAAFGFDKALVAKLSAGTKK